MKKILGFILIISFTASSQIPVFQPVPFATTADAGACDNYRLVTDDVNPANTLTDYVYCFHGTYTWLKSTANGGKVTDAQGDDIRFSTDGDGSPDTYLTYEIEKWDAATGAIVAWIKIPSFTSSSTFYIYYGNSSVTTFQGGSAGSVWNSNYKIVHHFEGSLNLNDETTNGNNATNAGSVASVTGKVGNGADFPGGSGNYLNMADAASQTPTGSFMVSAWVNKPNSNTSGGIIDKYFQESCQGEYTFGFYTDGNIYFWVTSSAGNSLGRTASSWSTNQWNHIVGVWTGGTASTDIKIYVNGTQVDNANFGAGFSGTIPNTCSPTQMGWGFQGLGGPVDATMDEIRLNLLPTNWADWITADYTNQNSTSSFTVGSENEVFC